MYQKYQRKIPSVMKACLAVVVMLAMSGCDKMLPTEFKSKEYATPDIDKKAATILSDTTGHIVNSLNLMSLVDSATYAGNTENKIIQSNYNTLAGRLPELIRDSLMVVEYPAGMKTNYAVLKVTAGQSKDIYLYTSLFYTEPNLNQYVTVQIVKSDTSLVTSSEAMTGEVASGNTQTITVASESRLVPTIRARYTVHVDEGVYIVRLIASDAALVGPYKMLILSY
jgi:hypothetical protein